MDRILNISMRPEFALDVLVPQQPHLGRQLLAVDAEDPSVQVQRREKRLGRRAQGGLGGDRGRRGQQEALVDSHLV